jgi:hypothetical protein
MSGALADASSNKYVTCSVNFSVVLLCLEVSLFTPQILSLVMASI